MVYNYTKPRGPIAAMYSSPGPCYGLPGLVGERTHDPRSVHYKGASYSFGIRHGKWKDDASPGPCYGLNKGMYRDGADGTPHYSLYSRSKDCINFKTPGPGAYSPEHSGPTAQARAPAYVFGTRHRHRRTDNTPAPNTYTPLGMIGKITQSQKRSAPVYSITGRSKVGSFSEDHQKTPGPGVYCLPSSNINKGKLPEYSMTSRNVMPGDGTQKPGPGAHSPEKVYANKRQHPSFSFGIRHSAYVAPLIVDCAD